MQELILNSEVKILATQLAEKTYARFANFNGHYRNTASNHLVGHRLGDLGRGSRVVTSGRHHAPEGSERNQDGIGRVLAL